MNEQYEERRVLFKPAKVQVLLVGESRPQGGRFFYHSDAILFRYTNLAFEQVFGEECGQDEAFLNYFKALGCYLDDLCLEPVNKLDKTDRLKTHKEYIPSLATRLKNYQPQAIVAVMLSIRSAIETARNLAGLIDVPLWAVPHPSMGNHHRYKAELARVIEKLASDGYFISL